MSRSERPEEEGRYTQFKFRRELILALIAALFAVLVSIVAKLFQAGSATGMSEPLGTILPPLLTGLAAGVLATPVFSYLSRVRYRDVRVALTGRPRAGKTTFSVALFNSLLSGKVSGIGFTAEARTVISVYQAINNISLDVWPQSTATGVVNRYEGRIRYGSSRSAIDLELGDSAGEYWTSIDGDSGGDVSYLNYVVSADAIAHVIPVDALERGGPDDSAPGHVPRPGSFLLRERNDLLLASRLARSARKSQHLLIVISKLDLWCEDASVVDEFRFKVWGARSGELPHSLQLALGPLARDVEEFLESLRPEFASVALTFSSITSDTVGAPVREEISRWLFRVTRNGGARN